MSCLAQQVVQRGAFGVPASVFDETQTWSTPLLVASAKDVEIYIPDVSTPEWLRMNYADFQNKGTYSLSMFTFYKTPESCRVNQAAWGLADSAHLDACVDIGYRVRQAVVDPQQKTVTLVMAAMVGQDGQLNVSSVERRTVTVGWNKLDANTAGAIRKANDLISRQMSIYDAKQQSVR